jgi:hypothetical protein
MIYLINLIGFINFSNNNMIGSLMFLSKIMPFQNYSSINISNIILSLCSSIIVAITASIISIYNTKLQLITSEQNIKKQFLLNNSNYFRELIAKLLSELSKSNFFEIDSHNYANDNHRLLEKQIILFLNDSKINEKNLVICLKLFTNEKVNKIVWIENIERLSRLVIQDKYGDL